ncbi:hypothetical protein ACFS3C_04810 [Azotobacter vinelandii]
MLSDFKQQKISPYELLDRMKTHPSIAPLIAGSEMKEYAAHLIPEGGYNAIPQVYGDGWMIAGDAGQFVNGIHREGSNLAMTTGMLAAQTLVELRAADKPFSAANLAEYKKKLDDSFVMKDLKKYRRMPEIFHKNKQFFTTYPDLLSRAAQTLIRVDGVDKKTKEKEIKKSFIASRSLFGLIGDAFKFWRAVE